MHEGTTAAAKERPFKSIAIVTSIAFSLVNFRGPLIRSLIDGGVRVFALAPDYDDELRRAVRALGAEPIDISLQRTGMRPLRDVADMLSLLRLFRNLKVDAAFCYFIKPVIYGSIAARAAGIKRRFALVAGLGYVYTSDGLYRSVKRDALRLMASGLYWLAFRACERVFFQNEDDIAHFVTAGLLQPSKAIRLNGTGVDLERFAPAAPVSRPVIFLLMARLLREKGICEFVEAARVIKRRYRDVKFILLGGLDPNPGALGLPEVESWVREGVIEWHGHVDDVRPWIGKSSVYVLPSYREGTPRSTQEAMAMGRPIVTTDAVGCRETVRDGINGFLVPVRDSASLVRAMVRFIEDPGLIGEMGLNSRRLAEEKFDVHEINKLILRSMGLPADPAERWNKPVGTSSSEPRLSNAG